MPSETDTKSVTDDLNNKFILMIKNELYFPLDSCKTACLFYPFVQNTSWEKVAGWTKIIAD